eukprot:1696043-Amphidinium_carterae.1
MLWYPSLAQVESVPSRKRSCCIRIHRRLCAAEAVALVCTSYESNTRRVTESQNASVFASLQFRNSLWINSFSGPTVGLLPCMQYTPPCSDSWREFAYHRHSDWESNVPISVSLGAETSTRESAGFQVLESEQADTPRRRLLSILRGPLVRKFAVQT